MDIQLTASQVEKFFNHFIKIGEDDCWLWRGANKVVKTRRYGVFTIGCGGQTLSYSAHVVSYVFHNGPFIDYNEQNEQLFVLHTCDVSLCVNPKHLYLGTHRKNMEDWQRRGKNANSVFTPTQVNEIRFLIANNANLSAIARHYKIAMSVISNIKLNKSYSSIPYEEIEPSFDYTSLRDRKNMKLSNEDAIKILELLKTNTVKQGDLAKQYNISPQIISDLKAGRRKVY